MIWLPTVGSPEVFRLRAQAVDYGSRLTIHLRRIRVSVRIDSLGIDRLSVRDRLDLIEQIWDSLPDQVEPQDVPDWHVAELAKRRASAAESPGVGKPWREVLERLEGGS